MHRFSRTLVVLLLFALGGPTCFVRDARAAEPSPEYQATLRRTLELRKQRRAARGVQQPVGAIVPYPMPPALIIRHTREVHEEIDSLFRQLRYVPN